MDDASGSPTLINVILWGNTATNGPGIYNVDSTPSISYSVLQESGCPSGATYGV